MVNRGIGWTDAVVSALIGIWGDSRILEKEKDDRLPFLDVLVTKEGGKLVTSVYRKPTHTERYIPFHSHHHPRTVTGVLRCMRDRAHNICHPSKRKEETDHLTQVSPILLISAWQNFNLIVHKPFILKVLLANFTNVVKGDTRNNYMWYMLDLCIIAFQQALPLAFEPVKGNFSHSVGSA